MANPVDPIKPPQGGSDPYDDNDSDLLHQPSSEGPAEDGGRKLGDADPFDSDPEGFLAEEEPVNAGSAPPRAGINKKLVYGVLGASVMFIVVVLAMTSGPKKTDDGSKGPIKAGSNPLVGLLPTEADNEDRFPQEKHLSTTALSAQELVDGRDATNRNPNAPPPVKLPDSGEADRTPGEKYGKTLDPQTQALVDERKAGSQKPADPVVERNGPAGAPAEPQYDAPTFFFPTWNPNGTQLNPAGSSGPQTGEQAIAQGTIKAAQIAAQSDFEKQNQQEQKDQFLHKQMSDYNNYSTALWSKAIDPGHELKATSLIPVLLLTAINTDNPGMIAGQVSSDVYDSATGYHLLVPKGSRVVGTYNSTVSFNQNRVQIIWSRIIYPNQDSISIVDSSSVDQAGQSGLSGSVDNHYSDIAAGAAAASFFDILVDSVTAGVSNIPGLSSINSTLTTRESLAKDLSSQIITRVLNRQPTITIPEGTPANIMIMKDLILRDYVE